MFFYSHVSTDFYVGSKGNSVKQPYEREYLIVAKNLEKAISLVDRYVGEFYSKHDLNGNMAYLDGQPRKPDLWEDHGEPFMDSAKVFSNMLPNYTGSIRLDEAIFEFRDKNAAKATLLLSEDQKKRVVVIDSQGGAFDVESASSKINMEFGKA